MSDITDLPLQIALYAPGDDTTTIYFEDVARVILPTIVLSGALATDARASFSRFKRTTVSEILGDSDHAPISDSALLESGRDSVIALADPNSLHLLPLNGSVIAAHLAAGYDPINLQVGFTSTRVSVSFYEITH